ncbi:Tex family protein [Bradymonas sediminis]|uniref:RNA-binding transcriptional accessory protein n=1 Tax=Bradymonas sediminis TaxID=1548548 RepID=A0A2Z4FRV1_9DELT|nr:Tex family protein [Bradymonas sediminis]AWV91398.1 RNA-binding transcriptional accessory protein [Bradymonas sediminis]TDP76715.1 uncharacterized protein DFR33_102347 [Bradymonas sediminis]
MSTTSTQSTPGAYDVRELIGRIAKRLNLSDRQVRGTVDLLDEGNTVPFIARYRKEGTGNLDEVQIRDVAAVAEEIRQLEDRRAMIVKTIEEQGKLTKALRAELERAETMSRLDDLYAPYKQKRRTRGQKAREAGLEPVVEAILQGGDFLGIAQRHIGEDFGTVDEVIGGAKDIIAEDIADDADVREHVRDEARKSGRLGCRRRRGGDEDPNFKLYFDFSTSFGSAKPHQVLAIRRGEKEKVLSAGLEVDADAMVRWISRRKNNVQSPAARRLVDEAIEDSFKRLIHPSTERDLRRELEEKAEEHAINVFGLNLKNLLLQPPLAGQRILGIDPGYRTGCKIAAVDETGALLGTSMIHIHDGRKANAPAIIRALVEKYEIDVIAVGNGTGSRETEQAAAEAIRDMERSGSVAGSVHYAMVNEAGASIYSASDVAREEFPDLDVSVRGAVSIGRRLQDPLAELVKIDPKSIGVGMYQHDVNQTRLMESLDAVVEDVVNGVGVDVNSASEQLLARVAGIGPTLAARVIRHRGKVGQIGSRKELEKVRGLGAKTFEQCAGFLRIRDGSEPLDRTGIHPENYDLARAILKQAGGSSEQLGDPAVARGLERLRTSGELSALAERHNVGKYTLNDIVDGLLRPGRDPRDDFDRPQLRSDVLSMDDLEEGMQLVGTVRNVVDFGAFVDIGVKQDGLVHVSEMAQRYVKNPHAVLSVGDQVKVVVVSVDQDRGRIALSIKQAK